MNHEQDVQRVALFFESMKIDDVPQLSSLYAPDAWFKDPFNEVRGVDKIRKIFSDMFQHLDQPCFVVETRVTQGEDAFFTWRFLFRMKRFVSGEQCIRGVTHLRFDTEGRVVYHRDYWDAAEELYEKIPMLGAVMRFMRRRGASSQDGSHTE